MNGFSDSHDDEDWPTPGLTEPVPAWTEYDQLKEAIHDYLDHEPRDPQWTDIWQALAVIMGEYQRDAFVQAHNLDRPARRACIARLIDGRDECPHHAVGQDDDPNAPPHKPPAADHSTLWLDDDGSPALYGMHVYPGNIELLDADSKPRNQWFDLCEFASQYGLELSVHGKSWYNLGSTVHIVLYPPERYRSLSRAERIGKRRLWSITTPDAYQYGGLVSRSYNTPTQLSASTPANTIPTSPYPCCWSTGTPTRLITTAAKARKTPLS